MFHQVYSSRNPRIARLDATAGTATPLTGITSASNFTEFNGKTYVIEDELPENSFWDQSPLPVTYEQIELADISFAGRRMPLPIEDTRDDISLPGWPCQFWVIWAEFWTGKHWLARGNEIVSGCYQGLPLWPKALFMKRHRHSGRKSCKDPLIKEDDAFYFGLRLSWRENVYCVGSRWEMRLFQDRRFIEHPEWLG